MEMLAHSHYESMFSSTALVCIVDLMYLLECNVCGATAADAEELLLQCCVDWKVLPHSLWISLDFSAAS